MNNLVIMPTEKRTLNLGEYAEEATIIVEETATPSITFLEANTDSITLEELANKCVVPTWANLESTISHQDFISCVHEAASSFYAGEKVSFPEIRVSHIVRGRIPSALGKKANELLECEKDTILSKTCVCFTVPHHFLENNKRAKILNCA